MEKIKRLKIFPYLIITVFLILNTMFIIDHLKARSLWLDEAVVANIVERPLPEVYHKAIMDVQPLFYIYSIKLWVFLWGNSELALRGFSVLFAVLLVALLYKAGKDIFQSKKVGLLAMIVASTNYFLIWFGTQARPYTLAALLGLLSYYFFIKLVQEKQKRNSIFYLLFTIISIYTHTWLFLVFISQILNALVFRLKKYPLKFKRIVFAQGVILLFSLPNVLIALYQGEIGSNVWITKPPFSALLQSFKYLTFGSFWIYLIFSLIALVYIIFQKSKSERFPLQRMSYFILGLYLFFPLISAWILSQFQPAYVVGRYEMIVLPALLLILAHLLSQIKNKYIYLLMIFCFIIFAYRSVIQDKEIVKSYQATNKSISLDLIEQAQEGDVIITTDLAWASFYYYFRNFNENKKIELVSYPAEISKHPAWKNLPQMLTEKEKYEEESSNLINRIKMQIPAENKIWVLYKGGSPLNEILYENLNKNFQLTNTKKIAEPHEPLWFDLILVFENIKDSEKMENVLK